MGIEYVFTQVPGIIFGVFVGAVIMFFVARKNPKWVEDTYQAQRAVSMQGTEKLAELQAKIDALEFDKRVTEKVQEVITKLKG